MKNVCRAVRKKASPGTKFLKSNNLLKNDNCFIIISFFFILDFIENKILPSSAWPWLNVIDTNMLYFSQNRNTWCAIFFVNLFAYFKKK